MCPLVVVVVVVVVVVAVVVRCVAQVPLAERLWGKLDTIHQLCFSVVCLCACLLSLLFCVHT